MKGEKRRGFEATGGSASRRFGKVGDIIIYKGGVSQIAPLRARMQ